MTNNIVTIVGVPINNTTIQQTVEFMNQSLSGSALTHIMTPNNEMIVHAASHPLFHDLLCRSSYNIPDSTGVVVAAKLTGQILQGRVPGVDTLQAFCLQCDTSVRIFLLGAAPGIAMKTAYELKKINPNIHIVGTFAGSPKDAEESILRIQAAQAQVLFVAYGAPVQDEFIDTYKDRLPTVKLAMGVGGSFDFIAGKVMRAPFIFRRMGLEWLWRFIKQPSRYKRMFNALVVFPWLCLRYGSRKPV